MLVPASPAYDVWAWLVWGREVGHLDLATVGGPSWKPLPVLGTSVLALAGGAAPTLWLLAARTAALLAVVGVYRLGARLAGTAAGVVAGGLLLLTPDREVRFLRVVLEGHTAAITAALAVWAIECHLAGRRRLALLLLFLLALDRPEAWPFLALEAWWCWRDDREHGWYPVALLGLVPILWFGGDWWGSGSPWHGADAARVVASDGHRFVDALARVRDMVPWVAWLAAAFALVRAVRQRNRVVLALAGVAAAWSLLVVAMSAVLGYAALSRFLLPAAAIVCVLAGVGAVWAVTSLWRRSTLVTVVVVALAVVALGPRVFAFPRSPTSSTCATAWSKVSTPRSSAPVPTRSTTAARLRSRRPTCPGSRSRGSWRARWPTWSGRCPTGAASCSSPTAPRPGAKPGSSGASAPTRSPFVARTADWIVLAVGCGRQR